MKVVKLSENIYEVRLSFWCWSVKKGLIKGLQEIQSSGKTVNVVIRSVSSWVPSFVIVTS